MGSSRKLARNSSVSSSAGSSRSLRMAKYRLTIACSRTSASWRPPQPLMRSVRRDLIIYRPAGQERRVVFRILKIISCITFGVLFTSTVMGQARVGDWEFRVESDGTAIERRVALTPAQPYSDSKPRPNLVIRRMKLDSPLELLITATHDKEKNQCGYKDWKIMIDATNVPVLGYTFEPAKTELKAKWGSPEDELWSLFRKGLKLVVQVEQKCEHFSGESNLINYTFSLRGSSAAYKFVLGSVE